MVQAKTKPTWVPRFTPEWLSLVGKEIEKDYFQQILKQLYQEKMSGKVIFPPPSQVFDAFYLTPFDKLKVVILGQDPYHGKGQAHGLSFSVCPGVSLPPSLRNIYKELKSDMGIDRKTNGCLNDWAEQGILLLNASLSVEQGMPMSHQKLGWQQFTDFVIQKISEKKQRIIFILWGRLAQQKESLIDHQKHYILKSPHPSPFSADKGFFGSRPFSKSNAWLQQQGLEPINW